MRRYQFQPGDSATAAGSDAASSTQTPQVATALRLAERQAKCKRYAKQGVTVVLPDSGSDHSAAHEAEVATGTLKGMIAQHESDPPKAKQGRWGPGRGSAQSRNPSPGSRQHAVGASPPSQQASGASSSPQVATDTRQAAAASPSPQVATDTSRTRSLLEEHEVRRVAFEAGLRAEALSYIRFLQS